VLDAALGELSEDDREAILLRFFENRDFNAVARSSASATTPRGCAWERALEKLRAVLGRRGLSSTTAALAASLGAQAVTAAPAGLAATVTGAALAGAGTTAAAATFMSMSKLQIGIAAALAVAGTTGFVLQESRTRRSAARLPALQDAARDVATLQQENARLARTASEGGGVASGRCRARATARRGECAEAQAQKLAAAKAKVAAAVEAARNRIAAERPLAGETSTCRDGWAAIAKFQVRPQYPASLRGSGLSGEATVAFTVDAAGNVVDASAVKSTNDAFVRRRWTRSASGNGSLARRATDR